MAHPLTLRPAASVLKSFAQPLSQRTYAISRTPLSTPLRAHTPFQRPRIQPSFRRLYANEAPQASLSPQPPKKKRAGFFRWTWRFTYLSFLAGVGYVGYGVYQVRHPADQQEPDPTKKTLVVLGKRAFSYVHRCQPLTTLRHWVGLCLAPQETRH